MSAQETFREESANSNARVSQPSDFSAPLGQTSHELQAGSRLAPASWLDALTERLERRVTNIEDEKWYHGSQKQSARLALTILIQELHACAESASNESNSPTAKS